MEIMGSSLFCFFSAKWQHSNYGGNFAKAFFWWRKGDGGWERGEEKPSAELRDLIDTLKCYCHPGQPPPEKWVIFPIPSPLPSDWSGRVYRSYSTPFPLASAFSWVLFQSWFSIPASLLRNGKGLLWEMGKGSSNGNIFINLCSDTLKYGFD